MKIGTELLLKTDSFGSKKGDELLYLYHCRDSGVSCVKAVVIDDHFRLLMKEWKTYSLEQAYNDFVKNSIIPVDLEQFSIRFTTIKPRIDQVCIKEDLLFEKERLEKRLNYINNLMEQMNNANFN